MENQAEKQLNDRRGKRNKYLCEYRIKNKAALKDAAQERKNRDREAWLKRKREGAAKLRSKAKAAQKVVEMTVSQELCKKRNAFRWSRFYAANKDRFTHARHKRRTRKYANSTKEDLISAKEKIKELQIPGDYQCEYCWNIFPHDALTIDHIIPISKGGPHSGSNLARACLSCNSRKKDKLLPFGCFA